MRCMDWSDLKIEDLPSSVHVVCFGKLGYLGLCGKAANSQKKAPTVLER